MGTAGLAHVTLWQYIREGQDTINICLGVKCWEAETDSLLLDPKSKF